MAHQPRRNILHSKHLLTTGMVAQVLVTLNHLHNPEHSHKMDILFQVSLHRHQDISINRHIHNLILHINIPLLACLEARPSIQTCRSMDHPNRMVSRLLPYRSNIINYLREIILHHIVPCYQRVQEACLHHQAFLSAPLLKHLT